MVTFIMIVLLIIFYVVKAILSEKDIISDESNQILNDTINDVVSGSYSDSYDD